MNGEYQKALEVCPDDAEASYNLALIYERQLNDQDKAMFYYKRYLTINPQAHDAAVVKKSINDLSFQDQIWGEQGPALKRLGEKESRW